MNYPVISLFSGAMGLDLGLEAAGLNIAISQDIDPWCLRTMEKNGRKGVIGDIRKLLASDPSASFLLDASGIERSELFAVVGGPPCQAYSTAGKRLGTQDERGGLFNEFRLVVEKLRPRFFVMENVKGLLSMGLDNEISIPGSLFNYIVGQFQDLGYSVQYGLVDAVNYGTPQFRERVILIGSRDGEDTFIPIPTHFQKHQSQNHRWRTLKDAIGDLPQDNFHLKFTPNILNFLKLVPEGGNWKSLPIEIQERAMGGAFKSGGGKVGFYRRLDWSQPSPTLVTSPIQKATVLCHPEANRPLSVKEYARIQGFPDDWQIEGDLSDCYRQIGNAVPIPLGKAIGEMLLSVATETAIIKSKRTRGTSVHKEGASNQHRFVFDKKAAYKL